MSTIPHSRFKAKLLVAALIATAFAIVAALFRPQASDAIAAIAGSFNVLCAALAGARAAHQWASTRSTTSSEPCGSNAAITPPEDGL